MVKVVSTYAKVVAGDQSCAIPHLFFSSSSMDRSDDDGFGLDGGVPHSTVPPVFIRS
jgi:hypothetical protein